jgi:hypothetical protein
MAINLSLNQSINAPITMDPSILLMHIKPLALLTIGIVIYAVLIFKFYKYLARRDLVKLHLDTNRHVALKIFLYLLNQIVIVPALIFFWFLVMACVLLLLSNNNAAQIMLVSMAAVAAIRIVSYYNQSLAEDLAKLLPLTLVAVFIMELDFSSLATKLETIKQMLSYLDKLVFYLVFAVIIELIMRIHQIIRDVLAISRHNKQIVVTSSKQEKKSYDIILDGTFQELNKIKQEEIAKEKARNLKQQKNNAESNGRLDI